VKCWFPVFPFIKNMKYKYYREIIKLLKNYYITCMPKLIKNCMRFDEVIRKIIWYIFGSHGTKQQCIMRN